MTPPTATRSTSPAEHREEPSSSTASVEEVAEELLDGEVLIEEISIDGMCGVY